MKIRPKNIAEGWKNVLTGKNKDISEDRMSVCDDCEHKSMGACNICGCPLVAKTKVLQESCPISKWDDIKIVPDKGIAIRLHETHKAKIDIQDGYVTITHLNPYKHKEPVENTLITLDVINLRGDLENIQAKDVPIKNIWTSHCGCYESRINGKQYDEEGKAFESLDDGQHFVMTIKYNTNLQPPHHTMNKNIKIVTNQGTIILKTIGEITNA